MYVCVAEMIVGSLNVRFTVCMFVQKSSNTVQHRGTRGMFVYLSVCVQYREKKIIVKATLFFTTTFL